MRVHAGTAAAAMGHEWRHTVSGCWDCTHYCAAGPFPYWNAVLGSMVARRFASPVALSESLGGAAEAPERPAALRTLAGRWDRLMEDPRRRFV